MRNPSRMCRDHRHLERPREGVRVRVGNSTLEPGSLTFKLYAHLEALSALRERMTQAELMASAAPLAKRGTSKKDTREYRVRQALLRLIKRGQLPPGVTLTPTHIIFG